LLWFCISQIEVENTHVHVMQLEVAGILVFTIACREIVLLEGDVMWEFQSEAVVRLKVFIKNICNVHCEILTSKIVGHFVGK
jgi:hypothetical protein